MRFLFLLLVGAGLLAAPAAWAQTDSVAAHPVAVPTRDLPDLMRALLHRAPRPPRDSAARAAHTRGLVVVPAAAYTLEARLLVSVTASTTFRRAAANLSTISNTLTYTQNRQIILATSTALWTADNRGFWLGDYRLLYYPQLTYGLGSATRTDDAVPMNYYFFRLHQTYYHRVGRHSPLYVGGGYRGDYRWRIESRDGDGQLLTDINGYRPGVAGRSASSGLVASVLRDTRQNALRPAAGETYLLLALRANQRALGSDANYQLYQFDARTYRPAGHTGNVLAFWLYGDFIRGENAPYLDLPATGWDTYSVTGRGYIQGRFRGLGLLYGEAEFRFNLTRSRVLGGVVFANGQTVRAPVAGFGRVNPAGGAGLRLCLAKKSSTYLSVDYAVGIQGSQGVFFNLGEVF
ncbi:MAG: hypothetical protein NVS3B25_01470 [Hymenobacter sp.]